MELLFYIIMGILYSLFIICLIVGYLMFMYGIFKFAFWMFDFLGIENPVIKIWSLFKNKQ